MAFDMKSAYGYNKDLAETGVKMQVGPDKEDYFLIRMIPNDEYTNELNEVMRKNHKILEFAKAQSDEEFKKIDRKLQCQVLGKTVVVGWGKGIRINGKFRKYTPETAAEFLLDFPAFRADAVDFALDRSNYPDSPGVDVETVEEIKKP